MNVIDIIIIFAVFLSMLLGTWRGGTREVLGVSSWGFSAISAYFLYPFCMPLIALVVSQMLLKKLIAILFVFFVSLVLLSAITYTLSDIVKSSVVGRADRGIGLLYGLFRGVVFVSVVAFVSHKTIFKSEPKTPLAIRESVLWPAAVSTVGHTITTIPEKTMQRWKNYLDDLLTGPDGEDLSNLSHGYTDFELLNNDGSHD